MTTLIIGLAWPLASVLVGLATAGVINNRDRQVPR